MPYKEKREIIIPARRVNSKALRITGPVVAIYLLAYALLWPGNLSLDAFRNAMPDNPLWILAILAGGIILHEGLHGITWALFCKKGFLSIHFGFMTQLLAPYCHCTEPLPLRTYIAGGLMPGIIMGILPPIYALAEGSMGWLLLGIFFSFAAGGDFAMMGLLRKLPRGSLVRDHPSELGCFVYEPQK